MKIEFHPEAIKNYNKRANDLLIVLLPRATFVNYDRKINTGIITKEIKKEEIKGLKNIGEIDNLGNRVSIYFEHQGRMIGLYDENYRTLRKLSEDILKNKMLYNSVSINTACEIIFDWMKLKYISNYNGEMVKYFIEKCVTKIEELEVWVPISYTIVEKEFKIGKVMIKNFSNDIFDSWEKELLKHSKDEEHSKIIKELIQRERIEKQGFAVAVLKLEAEKGRAENLAYELIEQSLSILRIFSPASVFINERSYTTIRGSENIEKRECYIIKNHYMHYKHEFLPQQRSIVWTIQKENIAAFNEGGLNILSELLKKDKRNSFQNKVLDSFILFSRSTLTYNISDKLVYIFASLESILLRNDTEPIQQNLADRIAFAIENLPSNRIKIAKNIKDVYKFRSNFVHHGIRSEEVEILNEFLRYAWTFLISLLQNIDNFTTKEKMIEAIEKRRYGA